MGLILLFLGWMPGGHPAFGQPDRWQQRAEYEMEVRLDVRTHQYTGRQQLIYYNNSPDTLRRVFYHLYFNAFQPNSMMDVRSRSLPDPDRRVRDRIAKLREREQGYLHARTLLMDGQPAEFEEVGTILEVDLPRPLLPGTKTVLEMTFEGQVPLQIRRAGRDNDEGIDYSMTQWYPKLSEYDYEGWHANPYVGREFHGVFGDFDVRITLDSSYTVASTGVLQNPEAVGHGYAAPASVRRPNKPELTWHFRAERVHDFAWAADPDYVHETMQVPNGPLLRFFYQPDTLVENWKKLQPTMVTAFEYGNEHFGKYPYPEYAFVQGGDGGMEYAMLTLITGHRNFYSLVGVAVHEMYHSWYQMVLATNESKYPWMDEGFTTYAEELTLEYIFERGKQNPIDQFYEVYADMVEDGLQEPLTTHADHYRTNRAYGISSYYKGAIFLHQLSYIIGKPAFERGMKRYFETWKFRHPNPTDFKRIMEKESGIELDWYLEHWIGTTNVIDYGIKDVKGKLLGPAEVVLERIGAMPMPIDLVVSFRNGDSVRYHIPLRIMRGVKQEPVEGLETQIAEDWPWTHPEYTLEIPKGRGRIRRIEIDPSTRMADINRENNVYTR